MKIWTRMLVFLIGLLSQLTTNESLPRELKMLVEVSIRLMAHIVFFVVFTFFLVLGAVCTERTAWALERVSNHHVAPEILEGAFYVEVAAFLALILYSLICHLIVLKDQLDIEIHHREMERKEAERKQDERKK